VALLTVDVFVLDAHESATQAIVFAHWVMLAFLLVSVIVPSKDFVL
jgi:hypothetical protein